MDEIWKNEIFRCLFSLISKNSIGFIPCFRKQPFVPATKAVDIFSNSLMLVCKLNFSSTIAFGVKDLAVTPSLRHWIEIFMSFFNGSIISSYAAAVPLLLVLFSLFFATKYIRICQKNRKLTQLPEI